MKYICNDCVLVFETHGKLGPRKIVYCPNCGDNVATVRYVTPLKETQRRNWVQEELDLVDRCIKGELQVYAVAHKLGRSGKSVRRQMNRMMRNETRLVEGAWTVQEEKLILDYFDKNGVRPGLYEDLIKMLGRTKNQVSCKLQHMRKKGMIVDKWEGIIR